MRKIYRSAITGKFVSKQYAEQHPDITVSHTIEDAADKENED
jgi:hypothetical protein